MTVDATPRPHSAPARRRATWLRGRRSVEIFGGLAALAAGAVLYTRFSFNGLFWRDEAIYAYAGQQMTHGVPPYASVFDAKGPGSSMIAGAAAGLAHVVGVDDLHMIRLAFFACSLLAVVGVYLLALQLWRSVPGALVAAVVFASFKGYAWPAAAGPDGHAPAVTFAVIAMWLAAGRRWFWAAFAGSLALLVWQPMAVYPALVILAAPLCTPGARWRALAYAVAGFLTPLAATAAYFVSAGAFGKLVESAIVFPVTAFRGGNPPLGGQLPRIASVLYGAYGPLGALLIWGGLVLIVALTIATIARPGAGWWRAALREPLALVVLLSLLAEAAFALRDMVAYPRSFPLLAYAAIGWGGAVAVVARRLAGRETARLAVNATALALALALTVVSAQLFSADRHNNSRLVAERATACAMNRIIVPGTPLYALGDPVPLVLTHRRNPDRFIYLLSGVAHWKVEHTPGGFRAWTAQIADSRALVIVSRAWEANPLAGRMTRWLRAHYQHAHLGTWRIFFTPQAAARAAGHDITLTR
ncbi:MAG TPA: hypothetical protein VFH38_02285, partial [Jatrophihabitans sp.]|nr:hypothetical protein [Jatrophihabitans sp.]